MDEDLDALKRIAREIVDPEKATADLIPVAEALRDMFERRAHFRADDGRDLGAGQTRLDSGLAISPSLAAMCLRELARTLAFIRGLHGAIEDALIPGRPVRVLYAGCGPYALLAVPLMTIFPSGQVKFALLDIHRESLDHALALIDSFGLGDYVENVICADAAHYRIPQEKLPEVIVSETMAVCLRNEPQVAIARNLLAQAPQALMVPQLVRVEACLLNPSREFVVMPSDYVGDFPEPDRDRVALGQVFALDAAAIRSWEGVTGDRLPAGQVRIPAPLEGRYVPNLLTRIAVYGKTRLQDYDCSLTLPRPISKKRCFSGGETLHFHYRLGAHPGLDFELRR